MNDHPGLRLLEWKLTRDAGVPQRLFEVVAGNLHNPVPGDERWLARARAFAMHGIVQVEQERALRGQGRHTLWTGDLGMACVLWDCIRGRPGFPTLDCF